MNLILGNTRIIPGLVELEDFVRSLNLSTSANTGVCWTLEVVKSQPLMKLLSVYYCTKGPPTASEENVY